jgi:threonine synthase
VFLATAHPAKFREVVEPAIGESIPLPAVLADAIKRPRHAERLPVDYPKLKGLLVQVSGRS